MPYILIIAAFVLLLFILSFVTMLICFFRIFYSARGKIKEEYPTPPERIYDPYREQMIGWIKATRALEHRDVSIKSFDGLTLCGKYFEYSPDAPIELMLHGYKGCAERDLCGGVQRCFEIGHSALIVDHRASGASEGRVITFGAKESLDCVSWIDFIIKEIDPSAKIILTGISMGAATVMMASSMELPENVVGVLADCGYTSTKEIIKKVMRDMKLPADILYPFARLSARIFGGFDPEASSPIESMKKCHLPIIFFHGDTDAYVPCYMSEENYGACVAERKRLVITHGAGHGLCFPVDPDTYFKELRDFFDPIV